MGFEALDLPCVFVTPGGQFNASHGGCHSQDSPSWHVMLGGGLPQSKRGV